MLDDDPDDAHRRCRVLLDVNPYAPPSLFLIGSIEARCERFGLAVNIFRRVVDLKPDRAEAWNNVGMALEGMHKPERARKAFMEGRGKPRPFFHVPRTRQADRSDYHIHGRRRQI